ncbi:MAG: pyridoxal phosphate-dependent aminotransferase [Chloroflexota bacterium]
MYLAERLNGIAPSMTLAITAKSRALKAQGIDVCGFGSGEPDFDTPEHIKQAAIAALERGETKYATVAGIEKLRAAIAKKLQTENGLAYEPGQIQVSGGAKQALYNVIMALVNPGDEVLIPAPYWLSYPDMVRLAGGTPVALNTREDDRFKITPDQLDRAVTSRTRLVILASPSNPTGVMYAPGELAALARVIVERDLLVISDEIYEKLTYGDVVQRSIGSLGDDIFARTITVNGFSKAYAMTGWRLGYAAGPRSIIEGANVVQSHSLSNVTTFAQYGALAALEGDQGAVDMMRRAFAERLEVIYQGLRAVPGITCVRPDGAFYVFPSIASTGLDSVSFSERFLEEEHVAVVPGRAFGSDQHIRFSYATDRTTIEKGIERFARFVSRLARPEQAT